MKKNKILNGKLNSYSAMAMCLVCGSAAHASVVYTDVDPDYIISSGDTYYIDTIDDDPWTDFGVYHISSSGIVGEIVYGYDGAAIAGTLGIVGSYSIPYASVIDAGTPIGPALNWIASTAASSAAGFLWFSALGYGSLGQWDNVTDKYVGIRFTDGTGTHYGWMRLDVSHTTIIVKDYAYESADGVSISAGDKGAVSITDNLTEGINIYSFNSDVYVEIKDKSGEYEVKIVNLNGELVYEGGLRESANKISLENFAAGNYIVEIISGENKISKKVLVE